MENYNAAAAKAQANSSNIYKYHEFVRTRPQLHFDELQQVKNSESKLIPKGVHHIDEHISSGMIEQL